jgi:hypothetical protein
MAGTQNQPAEFENVTYNDPSGALVGNTSTKLIGFWGKTPVTLYVGVGAASTYATTTNTTAVFGLDSLAGVTSMILQVSTITQALRRCGMIA